MAGTRTAPDFTTAANARLISLHWIDSSGDRWANSFYVPLAATAATIETIAAKAQSASQASLFKITDQVIRSGDEDPDNATTNQRNSVKDGINLLFKNPTTLETFDFRACAPVTAALQGNQDIPLLSDASMSDLILAILAVETGYSFQRAQYTERRDRKNNPVVK